MATLTDTTIASTYKQLLKLTSEGVSADASAKYVEDGLGTDTALSLSTTRVGIGTASPDHELHVEGETPRIQIESTSAGNDNTGLIFAHGGTAKYELWHDEDAGAFNFDQSVQTDGWGFNFRTYPSGGSDDTIAMTIKGSGNVGIGTTTVNANLVIENSDGVQLALHDSSDPGWGFKKDRISSSENLYLGTCAKDGTFTSKATFFETGHLQISSSSNVYLSIDTTQTNGDEWQILNAVSGSTSGLQFKNVDQSKVVMLMQEDGNVGIGETSPSGKVHIVNGSGITLPELEGSNRNMLILEGDNSENYLVFASPDDSWAGITFADPYFKSSGNIMYNHTDNLMRFTTNAVEAMRINSAGNVGIGVAPSGAPEGKLEVKNTAANDYAASFHNIANAANAYGIRIKCGADDASGTTYYAYCMDGDGGAVGHIANTSGTFALTDSSDERIKENIRDTEIDGLDVINSMQVRDFEWKKSGNTCIGGFVAQELEPVFAPAVTGEDGAMEEYEVSPAVEAVEGVEAVEAVMGERILPMGVSRDRLVPVLVKAIQELSAKVEALKTELQDTKDYVDHKQDYNSMAGRINSCEARIGHLEKG